jgi:lysophospholipid acyltransferase (LPLAT)-like uncharacterized protein
VTADPQPPADRKPGAVPALRRRDRLLADVVAQLLIGLGRSLRWSEAGREHLERARAAERPIVFVFWHNRLLYCCFHLAPERLVMMVSRSRDGELIARIAGHIGIASVRGSSSRGGSAAARDLVRAIREQGVAGGITPDGPRGPRYELQAGALLVAKLAGAAIVPVAVSFERKVEFTHNAGVQLPLPFTRAHFVFGAAVEVPAGADGAALEQMRPELERRLREVTAAADARFRKS